MIHIIKKITLWPFSHNGPSIGNVTSKGGGWYPKKMTKVETI